MKKNNENNATVNKSIITVSVNGMSASEAVKTTIARLESVEKSAFNIALLCAYTLGVTIPSHVDARGNEHGEAVCDKPIKKQADLLKLIGRSKATLSRWIKAMNLLIEKGRFTEFANGSLPFSYDKIIIILENAETFDGYIFSDLMGLSCDTLEAMVTKASKEEDTAEEDTASTSEESDTTEDTAEENAEDTTTATTDVSDETVVEFEYNGVKYNVNKVAFEAWLAENAIVK